jgi:hypothetical protein
MNGNKTISHDLIVAARRNDWYDLKVGHRFNVDVMELIMDASTNQCQSPHCFKLLMDAGTNMYDVIAAAAAGEPLYVEATVLSVPPDWNKLKGYLLCHSGYTYESPWIPVQFGPELHYRFGRIRITHGDGEPPYVRVILNCTQ